MCDLDHQYITVDEPVAKRYNAGKVSLSLLPAKALIAEAKVWQMGEQKYGRGNWQKLWGKNTVNVVMDSALRHMLAILDGEVYDKESGEPHAAHVRCNMAMLIEYYEKHANNPPDTLPK